MTARNFACGLATIGLWLACARSTSAAEIDEPPKADAAAVKSAEAALKQHGLRRQGNMLVLINEPELSKLLNDQKKFKREIVSAGKLLAETLGIERAAQQELNQYRQQRRELNAELQNVRNVERHNRIVTQINELTARMEEIQEDKSTDNRVKETRQAYSQARERYVQLVLDARKLADKLNDRWDELAHDSQALAAVRQLNEASGKTFALQESKGLANLVRQLEKVEESVLSEAISLRRDGGDTFLVDVTFGGKHTQEMCLDSGASIVILPHAIAQRLELTPGESAEPVILVLADGRTVQAKKIMIDSVRVGKFSVQNVEGAVLPADLKYATPLLGMSFLANFKFDIDPAAATLTMTRVEGDDLPPAGSASGEKPARARKRPAGK